MCNSKVVVDLDKLMMVTDERLHDRPRMQAVCNNAKTLATTGLQTIVVEKVSNDAALRNNSIGKPLDPTLMGNDILSLQERR